MRAGQQKARALKHVNCLAGISSHAKTAPGPREISPQNFILLTHYYFGQTANFCFSFLVTKAQGSFRMTFNVFYLYSSYILYISNLILMKIRQSSYH